MLLLRARQTKSECCCPAVSRYRAADLLRSRSFFFVARGEANVPAGVGALVPLRRLSTASGFPPARHSVTQTPAWGEAHSRADILGSPRARKGPPRLSTFASLTYCGVGLSRIPVIVVLRWQSTIIGAGYTLPGTGTRPDKRVAFDCVYISSGLRCA